MSQPALAERGGARRRSRVVLRAGMLAGVLAVLLLPSLAPATVTEQRKRLPPPAPPETCADPVQGVWRSHTYYPRQAQWYTFTLTIRRDGDALKGDIDLRAWDGQPNNAEILPCNGRHRDFEVTQPAAGKVDGLKLDFHGTSWRYGKTFCGNASGGYILDTFLGTIDPALQEFQSVNRYDFNGTMVEDVTVFRRVQCFGASGDQPIAATPVEPAQPPAAPPATPPSRFSCSCDRP
jgi:hypothetical protein